MTVCEIAKKYSCVLCGPGMTTSAGAMQVVSGLLELDVPLILDADDLNCLAKTDNTRNILCTGTTLTFLSTAVNK